MLEWIYYLLIYREGEIMVCHITIHSDNVMALKKLVVLIKYQINNQKMTI